MTTEQDRVNAVIDDHNGESCEVDRMSLIDSWIVAEYRTLRHAAEEAGDATYLPLVLSDSQLRAIHINVSNAMQVAMGETSLWWEIERAVEDFESLLFHDHIKGGSDEGDD